METIKIKKERIEEILPKNIQDTDESILSKNAKKVLACLMNYQIINRKAIETKFIICSNSVLSKSVKLSGSSTLAAVQELIEHDLIVRKAGKARKHGEKAEATEYYIKFKNLLKPLKKNTFEDLFSTFLEDGKEEFVLTNTNPKPNSTTNTNSNNNSTSTTNNTTNNDSNNDSNNTNNNLPSINSIHVKTIHSQVEKEKDSKEKEKEAESFRNEVRKELEHCNTEVEVYAVKVNFLGKLEKKRALLGIQGFDWYSSILGSAIREKLSTLEQENLEEAEAQTSWTESLNK